MLSVCMGLFDSLASVIVEGSLTVILTLLIVFIIGFILGVPTGVFLRFIFTRVIGLFKWLWRLIKR